MEISAGSHFECSLWGLFHFRNWGGGGGGGGI